MVANAGIAVCGSLLDCKGNAVLLVQNLRGIVAPLEDWDRLWTVNVKGTLICFRAAAKAMIKQNRGGRIISS
jgi:NAD(P)-dependent dehydrogenase (short-subunit alcohol dehydrogenase family)